MDFEINYTPRPLDCECSVFEGDKSITETSTTFCKPARHVRTFVSHYRRNAKPQVDEQIEKMVLSLSTYLYNLRNKGIPDCIKDKKNRAIFFKALCEYNLTNLSYSNYTLIINVVNCFLKHKRVYIVPSRGENIIEWTARQLNINWVHAALALGYMLGLRPENCFARFPLRENPNESTTSDTNFSVLIPKNLYSGKTIFQLENTYPIKNISGLVLQTVCLYSCNREKITVYANATGNIGTSALPALLPGANLVATSTDATIHLCLCPDVFWSYLTLAVEGKLFERKNIVVTGCFGGLDDVETLDVRCVGYHPVILICSPDRVEWPAVKKIAKKCQNQGASSVYFYPYQL